MGCLDFCFANRCCCQFHITFQTKNMSPKLHSNKKSKT
jgi:hypothetical protein